MSKDIDKRWVRWNRLIIDKKYGQVVLEFDEILKKKNKITFEDLILRDDALEYMGVISLSPNATQKRKLDNEKSKRRKS